MLKILLWKWTSNPNSNDEDLEISGPELSEEYLTHLFKNWRQLPPEDKRHSAHDFKDLDYNKSYLQE